MKKSDIIPLSRPNDRSYHVFKHRFKGFENLVGCDIYIEDSLPKFLDKLDTTFGLQGGKYIMKTTSKKVSLLQSKAVSEVGVGDILSLNDDLFIVARVKDEGFEEPTTIQDALFKSYTNAHSHYKSVHPHRKHNRAKYNLISLTTGVTFYDENFTLKDLISLMSKRKFRVIENIEFKECH